MKREERTAIGLTERWAPVGVVPDILALLEDTACWAMLSDEGGQSIRVKFGVIRALDSLRDEEYDAIPEWFLQAGGRVFVSLRGEAGPEHDGLTKKLDQLIQKLA